MRLKPLSASARYHHWLTKNPNGPHKKRVDVHISPYHWELFRRIRDCGSFTRYEAFERALEALWNQMIASGEIKEASWAAAHIEQLKRECAARAVNKDPRERGGTAGEPSRDVV